MEISSQTSSLQFSFILEIRLAPIPPPPVKGKMSSKSPNSHRWFFEKVNLNQIIRWFRSSIVQWRRDWGRKCWLILMINRFIWLSLNNARFDVNAQSWRKSSCYPFKCQCFLLKKPHESRPSPFYRWDRYCLHNHWLIDQKTKTTQECRPQLPRVTGGEETQNSYLTCWGSIIEQLKLRAMTWVLAGRDKVRRQHP